MITLNFSNVEKLVFHDRELQHRLPAHMFNYFEQWRMGQQMSFLRGISKAAILDFLNNLNENDIAILEEYFQERVFIERLNYSVAMNKELSLDQDCCDELCSIEGDFYFSTWRNKDKVHITFWR